MVGLGLIMLTEYQLHLFLSSIIVLSCCELGIAQMWDYVVFDLLRVTSFTQVKILRVCPCFECGRILKLHVVLYMYHPQFLIHSSV